MSNSQRLVLAIIDFLNQSIDDGTVKADDKESLEVAIQCIGEAFGVDPSNESQKKELSIKPATLQTIFDVFMKTRSRVNAASEPEVKKAATAEEKAQADKLKAEGNSLMSAKKYDDAIEAYTKAIALDPSNPVYYSNRAAAYSSKQDHLSAVGDAEMAISVDPKFIKAYHRLGCVCCVLDRRRGTDLQAATHSSAWATSSRPPTPSSAASSSTHPTQASSPASRTPRHASPRSPPHPPPLSPKQAAAAAACPTSAPWQT
ncbi:TPR-like protein [Schizophyllum commune Loenen D]|nr:TPR-like protein [Schizophyllum commune Loenen D]